MTEPQPPDVPRAARLAGVAEVLFLASLLAAPWPYGSAPDVARYALTALLLLAASLWALGLARSGAGLPALAAPAALLPALALLQVVASRSAAPVWTLEAAMVLAAMTAALVFWSERARQRGASQRLALAVLAVCAAEAAFGAVQWSWAPDRIYGRAAPIVTTPFASFVNHNHFAGLVEMGAVLAFGMALGHARRGGGPTPKAVALAGCGLGLVAVHAASRSRGGLIALVAGLGVLAAIWLPAASRRGRRVGPGIILVAALATAALVAFGLAVVPPATRAHLATILRGPGDASGEYRVDIAAATVRLAAAHPFLGSGLGAFADALPPFKRSHGEVRTTHAESDVLEFLAEAGLLGLLLAGALAARALAGLRDRMARGQDPFRKGLAAGAAAAAAALLVHSCVDFNLRIPSNALAFASLVGLAAAPRSEPKRTGSRAVPALAALLLGGLAVASAWRAEGAWTLEEATRKRDPQLRIAALDRLADRHPYLAEAYRARGLAWRDLASPGAFAAGRLERAEADLGTAVALRPQWGEAWAELGWVRFVRGDRSGAASALDTAAALDPTHLQVSVARAEFLARTGRLEDGVRELHRLEGRNALWTPDRTLAVASSW